MGKPRKDCPLRKPYYKGGSDALKNFISSNLKYPKEALNQKIEGTVEVTYDVNNLGKTFNINIQESLGYGCDEEVIRLIGLLKYEKAYNKGRNVTIHRKLRVDFKLPSKQSVMRQINYKIVSTKPKQQEPPKKPPGTISYTIKF